MTHRVKKKVAVVTGLFGRRRGSSPTVR